MFRNSNKSDRVVRRARRRLRFVLGLIAASWLGCSRPCFVDIQCLPAVDVLEWCVTSRQCTLDGKALVLDCDPRFSLAGCVEEHLHLPYHLEIPIAMVSAPPGAPRDLAVKPASRPGTSDAYEWLVIRFDGVEQNCPVTTETGEG